MHQTPNWVKALYPSFCWSKPKNEKTIYLTFDDGPIPEITPWILDVLKDYNAKATFFCVGENVKNYPGIFSRIINAGHSVWAIIPITISMDSIIPQNNILIMYQNVMSLSNPIFSGHHTVK